MTDLEESTDLTDAACEAEPVTDLVEFLRSTVFGVLMAVLGSVLLLAEIAVFAVGLLANQALAFAMIPIAAMTAFSLHVVVSQLREDCR